MPLVSQACLAYALGALAALRLAEAPRTAVIGLALAGGMLAARSHVARTRVHGTCLLVFAGAALLALAAGAQSAACPGRLPAAMLRGTLQQDAAPGAVVRAELEGDGCRARATLLVSDGRAPAGARVRISGEAEPRGDRVTVRNARLTVLPAGPTMAAARAAAGRRIDRLFGTDAPVVRALVIADMSAIPVEQRDRFARAGLVHMLSVSGLHVGIIALALELVAVALRMGRNPARLLTIVVLTAYVLMIGAPAPAVRAAVMLGLLSASRAMQRPTSPWAIVAVGSVVPLWDARTVLDLGWQLSVAGTIALVAGSTLARRVLPGAMRGVRRGIATGAIVSVAATVATAPIVAWTFGRLSLIGPVSNLLADPVMGVLQPALFLALLLPFSPAERLTTGAVHLLLLAFDRIASVAAAVPFAAPMVLPTTTGAVAAGVSATAFIVACVRREPARPAILALAAVVVMLAEPLVPRAGTHTELHMLDVGQGDALALRTRQGRWIVFDAGRSWRGGDAGRTTVVPYVAHRGGELAAFVLSHPHADHAGGAASLIEALRPAHFLDPGFVGTSAPYRAALEAARRRGTRWQRVRPGDSLAVDEVVLTTLAPDSAWAAALDDANLASAVVMVRVGAVRMLLTGDAEGPEEEWLLANAAAALEADVLKVAHHGSRTSTTPAFLDAVRPRVALVSVGAWNRYGHPSGEVMAALHAAGADVLRTDRTGPVVVRTDGRAIEVEARGQRWTLPPRRRH